MRGADASPHLCKKAHCAVPASAVSSEKKNTIQHSLMLLQKQFYFI